MVETKERLIQSPATLADHDYDYRGKRSLPMRSHDRDFTQGRGPLETEAALRDAEATFTDKQAGNGKFASLVSETGHPPADTVSAGEYHQVSSQRRALDPSKPGSRADNSDLIEEVSPMSKGTLKT